MKESIESKSLHQVKAILARRILKDGSKQTPLLSDRVPKENPKANTLFKSMLYTFKFGCDKKKQMRL